jgi:transmembrane 9 superfamily protein 2/4
MHLKKCFHFFYKYYLFINLFASIYSKGILDYSHDINSELDIQAGALSSINGIIPFSYEKLKICDTKKIVKAEDTLGEILTGEKIFNTGYIARTGNDSYCETLCYNQFDQEALNLIKTLIKRNYFINWYLDKLPAGLLIYDKENNKTSIDYFKGIPLGYIENDAYYIYNHLQFHILINPINKKLFNIVGFNILPLSINHNGGKSICYKESKKLLDNLNFQPQSLTEDQILFTYDIIFEKSNNSFALRWDHYKTSNSSIHWIGIFLSQSIILSLTIIIIIVLVKNINTEIDLYNNQIINFEFVDYYTWKELSGDVFRAPLRNSMLLSSIIGNGFQLFCMLTITLCLGSFGFSNPEKRANLLNIGIIFFCIMGLPGGYVSTKIYQFFKGNYWLFNALLTSIVFPGTLFFGYFFVNIVLALEKSSAAVNISDIISLFVLWVFCTFPLILVGSFLGIKTKQIEAPCKTNPVPSFIPTKPWYLHYKFMTFITGFISFGTFFIELNYVMGALWKHQIYFLATFLWISLFLFIIIAGEISIIVVFWNLCYGDYNWWWKSFLIGASPVIYFITFSIYYFFTLKLRRLSAIVVYFGIMGLISAMSLFICGSISVLITFMFMKFIYSRIKIN